jgi:hypothetical protein
LRQTIDTSLRSGTAATPSEQDRLDAIHEVCLPVIYQGRQKLAASTL